MSQLPKPRPKSASRSTVRDLAEFRLLFRDERALEEFARSLQSSTAEGAAQVLTLKGRTICAIIDVEGHRELLYEQLVDTLAARPELLGELRAALDDDDLVDG
jgi:hypothetical protein